MHECMKRLRVTASATSSPVGTAPSISHAHPHPGLARAWAMAQQTSTAMAYPAPSPPPLGAPDSPLLGNSLPAGLWTHGQQQQQQENMQPIAVAGSDWPSPCLSRQCIPSPPAHQRASQPLQPYHHPPNQHPSWLQQQMLASSLPAPHASASLENMTSGSTMDVRGEPPANYVSINSLLSQLHAERVQAGVRPRWKDDADDDDDDDDDDDL